jgi:hypothetical protein
MDRSRTILPRKNILGAIGTISRERHDRLLRILSVYLVEKVTAQVGI